MTTIKYAAHSRTTARDGRLRDISASAPAEIARELELMDTATRADSFALLPVSMALRAFQALDTSTQIEILQEIDHYESGALLAVLPLCLVVTLHESAEPAFARVMRAALPAARRARLDRVLAAPPDSIERTTDDDFVSLPGLSTVGDAVNALRARPSVHELVFVHDEEARYVGCVRASTLLRESARRPLTVLAEGRNALVDSGKNAAHALSLLRRHDLPAVAVCDTHRHQQGLVKLSAVLEREPSSRAAGRRRVPLAPRALFRIVGLWPLRRPAGTA